MKDMFRTIERIIAGILAAFLVFAGLMFAMDGGSFLDMLADNNLIGWLVLAWWALVGYAFWKVWHYIGK